MIIGKAYVTWTKWICVRGSLFIRGNLPVLLLACSKSLFCNYCFALVRPCRHLHIILHWIKNVFPLTVGWEFWSYQMCRSELIQEQQYEMKIHRMQCWIHCICYYSGKCMTQDIWKRKQQSNKRTRWIIEGGWGLPSEARHSKNTSGLNSYFLNKWGQIRERGRKRPIKRRLN